MRKTVAASVGFVAGLAAAWAAAGPEDFPRTASGKPDFSGTYDIATLTPYVRDAKHGDNPWLDPEAAAEAEARAAARMDAAFEPSDPNRGPPAKGANVDARSYDWFWMDPGTTMFKIDGKYRTSIIVDPPNGRIPEVSEAGKARRATLRRKGGWRNDGTAWWVETGEDPYDDPEGQSLQDRCLYLGYVTVPMRPVVYNNFKTIVQTDDHVMILVEWMHWPRMVRMNGEHLPDDMRTMAGDMGYEVLPDVMDLPRRLPALYRRLTG